MTDWYWSPKGQLLVHKGHCITIHASELTWDQTDCGLQLSPHLCLGSWSLASCTPLHVAPECTPWLNHWHKNSPIRFWLLGTLFRTRNRQGSPLRNCSALNYQQRETKKILLFEDVMSFCLYCVIICCLLAPEQLPKFLLCFHMEIYIYFFTLLSLWHCLLD